MPCGCHSKSPCECDKFVCDDCQKSKYKEFSYSKTVKYCKRPYNFYKKEWFPSRRPCFSCRRCRR